jgi:D-glycerate 3-kinase
MCRVISASRRVLKYLQYTTLLDHRIHPISHEEGTRRVGRVEGRKAHRNVPSWPGTKQEGSLLCDILWTLKARRSCLTSSEISTANFLSFDCALLKVTHEFCSFKMPDVEANVHQALDKLLPKIQERHQASSEPVVIGISGLQGSGKSTWASKIVEIVTSQHQLHTIAISLDDLYKTHDDLITQRDKDPDNKLYRTRGQPGTHDEQLAADFFGRLREYTGEGELRIPSFDKSKFNGEGDRAPEAEWPTITRKPDVVVFEGWCVGFRPLPAAAISEKHKHATVGKLLINTPAQHQLKHLLEVNDNLERYCDAFMGPQHFDFFIHIDADDLRHVYTWRLQQEHKMIEAKGSGMSDEQVKAFIDGYMPSYEIYLDELKRGFFEDKGRMVGVELDMLRCIQKVKEL